MKNYLTKPITEDKIKLRTGTLDGARELTKSISDVYTRLENDAKNRNLKLSSDDTLKTQRLLNTAGYTDLQGKKLKEDAILGDKTKVAAEKYFQSGIPKADVMNMQKQLNKNGITDRLGKALIVDGKLGPKTDGAVHEHLGKKRYTKEKDNNPMVKLPYYPGETKHEISEPVWRGKPEDIEVNLLSGKNAPTAKTAAGAGMPWGISPNGPTFNPQNKWDPIKDIERITENTPTEKSTTEVPSFMKEKDDSLLNEKIEFEDQELYDTRKEDGPLDYIAGTILKGYLGLQYTLVSDKYGYKMANDIFNIGRSMRNKARDYAESKGFDDAGDNEADAYRHFMWNCEISDKYNNSAAKYTTNAYEMAEMQEKNWLDGKLDANAKTVTGKMNQPMLMDLWNNAVARTLKSGTYKGVNLKDYSSDQLWEFALKNNLLITDASKVYEFLGVKDYITNPTEWTVDVSWDIESGNITFFKDGESIELKIGI